MGFSHASQVPRSTVVGRVGRKPVPFPKQTFAGVSWVTKPQPSAVRRKEQIQIFKSHASWLRSSSLRLLRIDALQIEAPFQVRKRGVETKIILAEMPAGKDEALIRNIALAHHWLERIKAGETFGDIAEASNISKRRVLHMIDLAVLAPDLVRDVLESKQPLGFTSNWCKSRTLPSD